MAKPSSKKRRTFRTWFARVGLALAIALLITYSYIGWTGGRSVEQAIQAYEKNGGSLDYDQLIVGPVPDDGNYAAIQSLQGITIPEGVSHEWGIDGAEVRARLEEACEIFEQARIDHPYPEGGKLEISGPRIDLPAWAQKISALTNEDLADVLPAEATMRTEFSVA